ncbi:MAG: OmpH family outer membrane protein [Nitrospiria bacterium]
MKKIFLYMFVILFSMPSGTATADSIKIGFVNAQKVLEESEEGKRVQERMQEYVTSRQNIIDLEEKELKQLEEDLTRQGSLLSPEAKKVKQSEFQNKLMAYQKKARELNNEVQQKKIESLRNFNKKLEGAVKQVAEKEGYLFVLDKNNEGGAVIYSDETYDITVQVIAQLDKDTEK